MKVDLKIMHLSNPTWQQQAHERWTLHCTPTIVRECKLGNLLSEVLLADLCDINISWIVDFKHQRNVYLFFFLIFSERRLKM